MRQGCPLSPILFNIVLEFLAREIRQEEIKGIQIGKETVKISLFADDMILYLKDPKNLYPKTVRHHKQLKQGSRIQDQLTKIISFLYTNNEQTEKEYMETIPFTITSKTKKIKYLRVNLKDVNDLYKENYKLLKKRLRKTTKDGKISHAHGLVESTQ
jgi:hypothetical protein